MGAVLPQASAKPPYWRLSACYFGYFAYIGAFLSYFGLYLQSLGMTALAISAILSMLQVMRLFAPYLWGALADRQGRRTLLIRISVAMALLCFVPLFFLQSFVGILLLVGLLALFWSAALPLTESLTLECLRERPERYGRVRVWGSLGFIVSVGGVGLVLDYVPLRATLWCCFGLLAATLLAALWLPETKTPQASAGQAEPLLPLLRQPRVVTLLAACFFMSVAHGPLYVFYSIYLVDHGYSKFVVGGLWSLGVVAEIFVFMFMPQLLRKWSVRTLLLASFVAAIVRFLLIGWGVESLLVLVCGQLLHAATFGTCHAAAMSCLQHWFEPRHQGRIQALYGSLSFGAGGLLGGLASGFIWTAWGATLTYSLASVAAFVGLVLVVRGMPKKGLGGA